MSDPVFDPAAFRLKFPAFADAIKYPDALLSTYFETSKCYIYSHEWCLLSGDCLQSALDLMTAHLAYLQTLLESGQTTVGILTGATIDKVSVSIAPPPTKNAWQYWLMMSPYGMQLLALLTIKSAGGFYVGGSPERMGFRKIYGKF